MAKNIGSLFSWFTFKRPIPHPQQRPATAEIRHIVNGPVTLNGFVPIVPEPAEPACCLQQRPATAEIRTTATGTSLNGFVPVVPEPAW